MKPLTYDNVELALKEFGITPKQAISCYEAWVAGADGAIGDSLDLLMDIFADQDDAGLDDLMAVYASNIISVVRIVEKYKVNG